jgi:iron(III) transport system substrate-binding protein
VNRRAALAVAVALPLAPRLRAGAAPVGPVPDADLVARAQMEKTLLFYAAMNGEDLAKTAAAFTAQYGIECRTLRLASNAIGPKLSIEQRAGHNEADVLFDTGYDTEVMKRNGLLVRFSVPESKDCAPGYDDPDGFWSSFLISFVVFMYNTNRVQAMGIAPPTAWADFARPEWRGKFAIYGGAIDWYVGLRRALGRDAADRLVRAIGANGPIITPTRQQATSLTGTGEYAAALAVFGKEAAHLKATGLPVDFANAPPTVCDASALALVKGGPHPNAGKLFIRWLFSRQVQQDLVVGTFGHVSPRKDVKSNPALWNPRMRTVILDSSEVQTYAEDLKTFNTWFGIPT